MSELKTAQAELSALKADLPRFRALVTENEQATETLRQNRADLSKLADASARVTAARELLEQHLSDIESARAEVSRLEAEAAREAKLSKMVDAAKGAREHRQGLDKKLIAAAQALEKAAEAVRAEVIATQAARAAFFSEGETLVPQFRRPAYSLLDADGTAKAQALAAEVEAKGAPLDYALDNATGRLGRLDTSSQHPLPQGDFIGLVFNAINLLDTKAAHEAARAEHEAKQARREAARQANHERAHGPSSVVLDIPEQSGSKVVECLGELVQRAAPIDSHEQGVWPSFGVTVLERDLADAKATLAEQMPGLNPKVRTDL